METQKAALEIIQTLKSAGFIAYFAGGWVRDHLMGNLSEDIDIATNAPPEIILNLFPKTLIVGIAFGIVVVIVKGHQFEVATFRRDINYTDGRKPEKIELATPEEDALRRDFTINGMFYDQIEGVIHDFVGGAQDIKLKVVRAIGDPYDRFSEDRLRMIRAIRFSARFDFAISPETESAIEANAATLFPAVAIERVWQEITKMSLYPRFDQAVIKMHRLGLLQVIFPELKGVHLKEIKKRVLPFPLFSHLVAPILSIIQLFSEVSIEKVRHICLYLKISKAEMNLAEFFVSLREVIFDKEKETYKLVHIYANKQVVNCLKILAYYLPLEKQEAFIACQKERMYNLRHHIKRVVDKTPLINSSLLIKEGIKPGMKMGLLIKEGEKLAIVHNLESAELILPLLKQNPLWLIE